MKFLYLANIRFPTEKAHGLQIAQMCEAFAQGGAEVTLLVARRRNSPEMRTTDPFAYYGVTRNFALKFVPCVDLLGRWPALDSIAFLLQTFTYVIALLAALLFDASLRADIYYSRDLFTVLAVGLFLPRHERWYEVHQSSKSRMGVFLQGCAVRHVTGVICVTGKLAEEMQALGARQVMVEHDGFQIERFSELPDREEARRRLNLASHTFIVGYTGRLHTLKQSKGIDVLVDAIGALNDPAIALCLVGGPADMAEVLRERWLAFGLPADRFLFMGQVPPGQVPVYLSAFDVCAIASPDLEFFRYYASPLKLFEYMAAGRAIVCTDLPATSEVLCDAETALLVRPGDAASMADAIRRLRDDPALRDRLGEAARKAVARYSWQARARRILAAMASTRKDH